MIRILVCCILSTFIITSCGKKVIHTKGSDVIKEVEKPVFIQKFEGFYHLQNGGLIELIANARGDISIESTGQQILSKNPKNGTFAEHPRIVGSDIQVINNKLVWSRNENYTSGHDIENDTTGANITGTKKTDYVIEVVKDRLKITINIWSNKIGNNINNIVAKRIIREL